MLIIVIGFFLLALAGWALVALQRKKINNFEGEAAILIREMNKVRKNNEHYLKFSEDVLAERDRAMKLYQSFGQATSVAQNWLLRDLQTAIRELNAYREKDGKRPVGVDPRLSRLVEEYPESIERTVPAVPVAVHPATLAADVSEG